jgi:hypothetical protein
MHSTLDLQVISKFGRAMERISNFYAILSEVFHCEKTAKKKLSCSKFKCYYLLDPMELRADIFCS